MTLSPYRRHRVFGVDLPAPVALAHLRNVMDAIGTFPDGADVTIETERDGMQQPFYRITITTEDATR